MPVSIKWRLIHSGINALSRTYPTILPEYVAGTYRVVGGAVITQATWDGVIPVFNTLAEAIADVAARDTEVFAGVSDFLRISYPTVNAGPSSIYLPDVYSNYAQYPYTVEAAACSFTLYRSTALDPPLNYSVMLFASVIVNADVVVPPPPVPEDPPDVTIQLKLEANKFVIKPSDSAVLSKYANPVQTIRAKFGGTRTAVITQALGGGFLIYEEVATVPTGPLYVYSYDRRLVVLTTVADLAQYLA